MTITVTTRDGVCTIAIAKPEKKNAMTSQMYLDFSTHLQAATLNCEVRSILIHGDATIFTAGNDLEEFLSNPPTDLTAPVFQFMNSLVVCDKPVIAAVRGPAVGIGTTLLLHCDFVFLSDDASLIMPFVKLGIVPEFGSSYLLPKLIGAAKASEFLLLGKPMRAQVAVDLGLATSVLPSQEVLAHALSVAEQFGSLPAGSVRETKKLMRRWSIDATEKAIRTEGLALIAALQTDEAKAAFGALLAKGHKKNTPQS